MDLADAYDLDEVIGEIRRKAGYNVRTVKGEIVAIERVPTEPQQPDTLSRIVGWEGTGCWMARLMANGRAV